jgi:glyoxylase-like metal-dependent hydrolase (beta-lactamase superfamily II)
MITRRYFLAATSASFFTPCFAESAVHKFTLGEMEISVFSDGIFSIPLSLALPNVKPDVIEAMFQAHNKPLKREGSLNIVLVKTKTDLILIDCGSNQNWASSLGLLPKKLETAGIDLEKITKVILTHGHPDHLWGALDDFNTPTFPNARYIFPSLERDYWLNPDTLAKLPDERKNMAVAALRYLKTLAPVIDYKNHDEKLADGVYYRASYGHTPGHMAVRLESKGQQLMIVGDAITNEVVSFAKPDWVWGSDVQPDVAIKTRLALLGELSRDKIPMLGYHLPYPGVGRIETKDTAYKFIQ